MATAATAVVTAPYVAPANAPASDAWPAEDAPPHEFDRFPVFPPRDDMMNPIYLHDPGHQAALRLHLGNPDTTIVLGEVPIARTVRGARLGVRIPDLLVAFNIRRAQVLAQHGYAINEQGKPPDFVLEIASDTTAQIDETRKLVDYANFGVTECWLFDPDWGQRYAVGLSGYRLVNGRYELIPIYNSGPDLYYGYSAVLGLHVCWEYGQLRWYDPAAESYLLTHYDERQGRIAAEAEFMLERGSRIAAEALADIERDGRLAAEMQANLERDARIAEQDGRIVEQNARIAAESEIERLRAEIERLRGGND